MKAQTGKNFWDEFKKLNNSIGKNKAKTEPAAKSPSKTSSGSSTSGKRDWSTNKRQ